MFRRHTSSLTRNTDTVWRHHHFVFMHISQCCLTTPRHSETYLLAFTFFRRWALDLRWTFFLPHSSLQHPQTLLPNPGFPLCWKHFAPAIQLSHSLCASPGTCNHGTNRLSLCLFYPLSLTGSKYSPLQTSVRRDYIPCSYLLTTNLLVNPLHRGSCLKVLRKFWPHNGQLLKCYFLI